MIRYSTIAVLSGLFAALPLSSQDAPKTTEKPKAEKSAPAAEDLVKQLGAADFKTRQQAETQLRALGESALPALRAARKGDDPEVQWRARRLIGQIERGEQGGLQTRPRTDVQDDSAPLAPRRYSLFPNRMANPDDVQQRFDRLFADLERDFGMDIPRHRFFQDDFFQDLHAQMEQMQKSMQAGPGSHGQSMSMQMGPNGVRVEVKHKNEKGEEDNKVYEAPDLDSFRQKYPGVLEQNGLGGVRIFSGGQLPSRSFQLQPWPNRDDVDNADPMVIDTQPLPPAGKRLGVRCSQEIPDDVREQRHLGENGGLLVTEVQEGTLAEKLGIEADDVVLEIAGRKITNTADVQDALGGVEGGTKVEVVVDRGGKRQTLSAEKPVVSKPKLEKRAKKATDTPK